MKAKELIDSSIKEIATKIVNIESQLNTLVTENTNQFNNEKSRLHNELSILFSRHQVLKEYSAAYGNEPNETLELRAINELASNSSFINKKNKEIAEINARHTTVLLFSSEVRHKEQRNIILTWILI